uniref:START domain-containing protein n=1 Tax=Steinernema glaseri TaxID=37863 RepID=A0A1I8ACE7_9BILA
MSLLPSPIVSSFTKVATTPSLDTTEYIADSPFTVTWLLKSLESNDETFKRISASSKVAGRNIGEGKGYLSKVYRVSINFENIQESYDVVMKVPGREAVMKLAEKAGTSDLFDDKWVSDAHKRECQFYSDYARYLDDIPLLKVYAAEEMSHLPGVL